MRARTLGLLTCLGLAAGVAGTARAATLKDDADRSVEVSGVTRVVPAGPPAQVLLQALAPGRLAGLVEPFKPGHAIYVDRAIAALPQIPVLSRTTAPGDVAMVAALKPDLCVDYGNLSARFVAATEAIQAKLQVPAVIYGGDLEAAGSVLGALGPVLGAEERAKELTKAIDDVLARVRPLAALPDAQRPGVYLARGPDGLQAMRAGSAFDEPIRLAGGRNVVVGRGGSFAPMAVADVVALKPSVVVFSDVGAMSSPLHDALPKGTTFVLDAGEPYPVLTGPPSLNRVVGLLALAAILHPEVVTPDPDAVTRLETMLFPIPAGLAAPTPLQVRK